MRYRYALTVFGLALALLAAGCMPARPQAAEAPDPAVVLGFAMPSPTPSPAARQALDTLALETPPPETVGVGVGTPEQVVQSFYEWYLTYARAGNPLVDRAYRASRDLTPELIARIDGLVASGDGGYDPFLCAQDVPERLDVGQAEVWGAQASVVVRTSFGGQWLNVDLTQEAGRWRLSSIACSTNARSAGDMPGPAQTVQRFYDWYLGYLKSGGNALADGAYKSSPFLTGNAVGSIDQILAAFGDGPRYDPILCAQGAPSDFRVEGDEPDGATAQVFVRMQWQGGSAASATALLTLASGEWKIDGLTCAVQNGTPTPGASAAAAVTADWQVYRDQAHGYEIKYPPAWSPLTAAVPPVAGGPVVQAVGFRPDDVEGETPVVSVEVYEATAAEFRESFPGSGESETLVINGLGVLHVAGNEYTGAFYIFSAPHDPGLHIVLRYALGSPIADLDRLVARMAETFEFDP